MNNNDPLWIKIVAALRVRAHEQTLSEEQMKQRIQLLMARPDIWAQVREDSRKYYGTDPESVGSTQKIYDVASPYLPMIGFKEPETEPAMVLQQDVTDAERALKELFGDTGGQIEP